jgi:hypothetical protein
MPRQRPPGDRRSRAQGEGSRLMLWGHAQSPREDSRQEQGRAE